MAFADKLGKEGNKGLSWGLGWRLSWQGWSRRSAEQSKLVLVNWVIKGASSQG